MTATKIDVLNATGEKSGSVELPAGVFDVETNVPLIHQVVVAQLAAARQGTHKTKNRGEVSGAGRKPFKQKGTGNARQGSIRAPHLTGGGVVHGPVPRDYAQRTPKKMIAAALRGSLSDRARNGRVHVVTELATDKPSTKTAKAVLDLVVKGRTTLVVVARGDIRTAKSVRNLADAKVIEAGQLNAYDVLVADDVVFTHEAFEQFVAGPATGKSVKAVATESQAVEAEAKKGDA